MRRDFRRFLALIMPLFLMCSFPSIAEMGGELTSGRSVEYDGPSSGMRFKRPRSWVIVKQGDELRLVDKLADESLNQMRLRWQSETPQAEGTIQVRNCEWRRTEIAGRESYVCQSGLSGGIAIIASPGEVLRIDYVLQSGEERAQKDVQDILDSLDFR